jgi:hypothetical protein
MTLVKRYTKTKQKRWLVGCFCLLLLSATACEDGQRIEKKWQLRLYQYGDKRMVREDSIFYNFQKGSFSAICLLPDETYHTYYGNYRMKGTELSVVLLPDAPEDAYYERYMGWAAGERTFSVERLTSSEMRLGYADVDYLFRAY